ncbi:MAG TPA: hypothetical protein DCO75_06335 [Fibrobacteres bacterium]|jgi:hypothetical protein|nr:hypothetical protein [Fibrobacterota bacterium]
MNTFTLRQIPLPVEKKLRKLSNESHKSLNKTALELLARAVGEEPEEKKTSKYRDVKSILLPWTDKEYEEFQNNTALFGSIDKDLWRK